MYSRRYLPIALVFGVVFASACNGGGSTDDGGSGGPDGGVVDMKTGGVCDARPAKVDLAVPPTGQMVMAGDIGTACKATADCKMGPTPVCWTQALFNMTGFLPVQDGYCSSACTKDADCGQANICMDFGMQGKFCVLGCGDAVTCRHPGYSCAYLGDAGMGQIITGCFPNGNLTCNPEDTTPCTEPVNQLDGACIRQAIEDDNGGICLPRCVIGDTCAQDQFMENTSCIFVDFTQGGDAFRGTMCFPQATTPKDAGATCQFSNDCVDGYECDNGPGGSNKCTKLCRLGKTVPTCPSGTACKDAFNLCTGTGTGLCK